MQHANDNAGLEPLDLIDIGANLTHESFDADLEEVLARAVAAGVSQIVITGADREGSRKAAELAGTRTGLYSTCGIHPHHAAECDEQTMSELRELLAQHPIVAVGETGLDFFRDISPRADQEKWFARHLELAAECGLPLFLHERDAHQRFAPILREHRSRLSHVVVHCFTGEREALVEYLELDCHIGITGWICDERRGTRLHELVALVPDQRLMIETDAPYLLPRNLRPKPRTRRNEPAWLAHILRTVAQARSQDAAHVAKLTRDNARRFFALPLERIASA